MGLGGGRSAGSLIAVQTSGWMLCPCDAGIWEQGAGAGGGDRGGGGQGGLVMCAGAPGAERGERLQPTILESGDRKYLPALAGGCGWNPTHPSHVCIKPQRNYNRWMVATAAMQWRSSGRGLCTRADCV